MTEKRNVSRVGEPVQVFLDRPDHERLLGLAEQLGLSKSDVLRRGIAALQREVMNPASHPIAMLTGLVDGDDGRTEDGRDAGREHDAVLAAGQLVPGSRAPRRKQR